MSFLVVIASSSLYGSITNLTSRLYFTPETLNDSILNSISTSKWDCSFMKPFKMETHFLAGESVTPYVFQEWLHAFQSDCSREKCDLSAVHSSGIGSSINDGAMKFGICLGQGKIYKPEGEWLWASTVERCTNGLKSLDCYFQEISKCTTFGQKHANFQARNYSASFYPSHTSVCALAATGRIPVVAVFGHLIKYITRMDEKLTKDVITHIQDIYSRAGYTFNVNEIVAENGTLIKPADAKPTFIAAHIRRGDPDGGRKQISMEDYMAKLNLQSLVFQQVNVSAIRPGDKIDKAPKVVDFYYMSGDNINANVDVSNIKTDYRIVLPKFTNTGKGEQEHHVRRDRNLKETLMIEYMVDVFMYSRAQGYVGVHSNIFAVIYSIRVATGFHNSCMFDTHQLPYHYICDMCDESFWRPSFGISCS